jgi:Tfp pilus assembly protein PilO
MMKMHSSAQLRKQQLWVLGIGALFVADFVLCGYWPSRSRLAALKERKAGYEQTIQLGRTRGLQLQAFHKHLTDMDAVVAHYDAYVPAEGSLAPFLRQVSELMTRHQLTDQVVVPAGKETETAELTCIPVRITGAGGLNEIFGFFRDMRGMERLVRTDRVALKNDNAFAGRVTMEAEVVIYCRPGKTPANGSTQSGKTVGGANHGV